MDDTNSKRMRLTGFIDVPAKHMDAVKSALPEHIRLTRAETGCVSFDVTPNLDHAGRFDVVEVFINQAAFDLHQKRTATSDWAQISSGIPRSYKIKEIS